MSEIKVSVSRKGNTEVYTCSCGKKAFFQKNNVPEEYVCKGCNDICTTKTMRTLDLIRKCKK